MPRACDGLWAAFLWLHAGRASGMGGPAAISAADIVAWQTLSRVRLTPWEVDVMRALDGVALRAAQRQPDKVGPPPESPPE